MRAARNAMGAVCLLAALSACASTPDRAEPPASVEDEDVSGSDTDGVLLRDDRDADHPIWRSEGGRFSLALATFDALDGWADDDHGTALAAFRRSCDALTKRKDGDALGPLAGTPEDWASVCDGAREIKPENARAFFEIAFQPVRIDTTSPPTATAYFEPKLEARRRPDARFRHPIYARPAELLLENGDYGVRSGSRFKPFFTRAEIDDGALAGRGLEIAYVEDPVDLFFLHIQGSGSLILENGEVVRVGFAAKNGHAYRSAGQEMIARGWDDGFGAHTDGIRAFYLSDPARGRALLQHNRSYIFFREAPDLEPALGPIGAMGVQLTAGRSVAVDRAYTPLGAPLWLRTTTPEGPLRRLVVAQDVGSAILGPGRIDYFYGGGDRAGALAGRMKTTGSVTLLIPKTTVDRAVESGAPGSAV